MQRKNESSNRFNAHNMYGNRKNQVKKKSEYIQRVMKIRFTARFVFRIVSKIKVKIETAKSKEERINKGKYIKMWLV